MKASKAVSLCWGGVQVLSMWKELRSIWVGKSWKYSNKCMRGENSLMLARTSFQSIWRGVGQNCKTHGLWLVPGSRLVKEWHQAKINNRFGVRLDVVIVSLPLSCSRYVTSAFAITWRIKMAPRTRIVKIGALFLSQFGLLAALNFFSFLGW